MYTRAYTDDKRGILIPESYGGTALAEGVFGERGDTEDKGKNPWEEEATTTSAEASEAKASEASAKASKWQFPPFLANIFKNDTFGLQKIGTEEILLIATAAFLFFSKEGDKECAIILLLLLFLG